MAYEVWIFEQSEDGEKPSRLVGVKTCPPQYSYSDADAWAQQTRESYAAEGLDTATVVRREASY